MNLDLWKGNQADIECLVLIVYRPIISGLEHYYSLGTQYDGLVIIKSNQIKASFLFHAKIIFWEEEEEKTFARKFQAVNWKDY